MTLEARHVAGPVTDAAMSYSMWVRASIEDAEAAINDGDAPTAIECIEEVALCLRYCEALLDGQPVVPDYDLLSAFVGEAEPPLPSAPGASLEEASILLAETLVRCESFLGRLPFTFPLVRTPGGFYPTLRTMRELERLRAEVGLGPFDWDMGAT